MRWFRGSLMLVLAWCVAAHAQPPAVEPPAVPVPLTPDGAALNSLTTPIQALSQVPAMSGHTPVGTAPTAHAGSTIIEHHPGHNDDDHPGLRMYWNNGLFAQSEDKSIVFHMGGTMQFDAAWFTAQPQLFYQPGGVNNLVQDGATPRRIRFRADGSLWDDLDFFSEVEFINGYSPPGNVVTDSSAALIPSVTEVWVTWKNIPFFGNLRVGNQKEPLGLEHLSSDRFLEFMERSFLQDLSYVSSYNNGFSPGLQVFRNWADQRIFTAVGFFDNINDPYAFATGDGEYAVTSRLAALPVWLRDGETYWHIGGAMSHRDTISDGYQSRIRGLIRSVPGPFLPVYADTGLLIADSNDVYSLETLYASGPLTIQAEYMGSVANRVLHDRGDAGSLMFQGWYTHVLYFLTGEHRTFNRNTYTANRVVPNNNFSWQKGHWGAWEVGGRYSTINLNDGPVRGGQLNDVTLGLTWYLNPLFRVYFNYEYLYRTNVSNEYTRGIQHAFGTRIALDF